MKQEKKTEPSSDILKSGAIYFAGGLSGGILSKALLNAMKPNGITEKGLVLLDNAVLNAYAVIGLSLTAFLVTSFIAWIVNGKKNDPLLQLGGLGSGLVLSLSV